jgi:hypothetical protein
MEYSSYEYPEIIDNKRVVCYKYCDMRLSDFIKNTLVDIYTGINEAASETKKRAWLKVNDGENEGSKGIDFDVAVTASSETSGKAGAELSVVSIGSIGGKVDAKIANEEISRVKFTIVTGLDSIHSVKDSLPDQR